MPNQWIKVIWAMAAAAPSVGWADVVPSALFADHMVIQRETQAPVWGSADAGEKVTVTGSWGETAVTTADASGKWMVKLKTPEAGGPHTLTLKGTNTVEIKDVLSGEVWFCSGQSNMDFEMQKLAKVFAKRTTPEHVPTAHYVKKEMETASDELLRQFTVAKIKSPLKPLTTLKGSRFTMPITLPPITRRQFIKRSLAYGGTAVMTPRVLAAADREDTGLDQNRVALLADTHIGADPTQRYPGTKWPGSPVGEDEHEWVNMADSLAKAVNSVIALNPRPAHLIVNGDCALSHGKEAEYKEFLRLVEPLRAAGITVHVTIGNHDNREKLWQLLPFLKREQIGVQADVIELPHANLVLLDTGRNGILGEEQLDWLAKQLDARADKPALVFAHFNAVPNRGVRPIKGMRDGTALLELLAERKHARAYVYGHTHEWQQDQRDHLHFINQPAVSYYFGKGHAHGWVDMKLTETSADLELHCINRKHKQHGERRQVSLKD